MSDVLTINGDGKLKVATLTFSDRRDIVTVTNLSPGWPIEVMFSPAGKGGRFTYGRICRVPAGYGNSARCAVDFEGFRFVDYGMYQIKWNEKRTAYTMGATKRGLIRNTFEKAGLL